MCSSDLSVGLEAMTADGVKDGVIAGCWMGYCSRALGKFRVRGGNRIRTQYRVRERIRGGRGTGGGGTLLQCVLCVCVCWLCACLCLMCVRAEWERELPNVVFNIAQKPLEYPLCLSEWKCLNGYV